MAPGELSPVGLQRDRTVGNVLTVALVALLALGPGCGRRRPPRSRAAPAPLEVGLVWHLGLSPSGAWLVFESVLRRGPETSWSVSWLMPATGGAPEPVEPVSVGSTFPVWSPRAEDLAYVRVGRTSSLRVRAAGEPGPKLTLDVGNLWLSQLCWSPDGTQVAALATDLDARQRDPLLIEVGTGRKHVARLPSPAAVSPLLFTEAGDGVLFAREESPSEPGQGELVRLLEAATTADEVVELGAVRAARCFVAAPVADALLLQLVHYPGTKARALFAPPSEPGKEPTVRSLGEGTFASAQSVRQREGGLEVVFERAGDLFIQSLGPSEKEEPRQITETRDLETGAIFSADGESVYFVRGAPGGEPTQVVVRSLSDGRETVIATVTAELVRAATQPPAEGSRATD